jgi:two-component system chemotaxis response regulator CheV
MDKFQQEIDERANLTSSNKFELLLFRTGAAEEGAEAELFGINVFKIREIVPMQAITTAVGTKAPMMGMVNLRGQIIPVVDLSHVMNCKPKTGLNILLVTEYSRSTQAFAVESVDEIVRLEWSQVMSAEAHAGGKFITSIARLNVGENAGKLVQVLDVEQIIYDISPTARLVVDEETDDTKIKLKEGTLVIAADDSRVARNLIEQGLKQMGIPYLMHKTGKEAWECLQSMSDELQKEGKSITDKVAMVLTDLEMPEMDGFTLTRNIKNDDRFKGIPVVVHSSLSGAENEAHTKSVGADGFVGKFSAPELSAAIRKVLGK